MSFDLPLWPQPSSSFLAKTEKQEVKHTKFKCAILQVLERHSSPASGMLENRRSQVQILARTKIFVLAVPKLQVEGITANCTNTSLG